MEKHPIHRVERSSRVGLYECTPGSSFEAGHNGRPLEVLEGQKDASGKQGYVVVQTSTAQDGTPRYTAYTNSERFEQELWGRVRETLDRENTIRKAEATSKVFDFCESIDKPKQQASKFHLDNIFRVGADGRKTRIEPWEIIPGDRLKLTYDKKDEHTGKMKTDVLTIGRVKSFVYEHEQLAIESNSMVTTNIDYKGIKRERQEMEMAERQKHHSGQTQDLWGQQNPNDKRVTLEEALAVKHARDQVNYIAGPEMNRIVCVDTNTFVRPEDMRPNMTYQMECNVMRMRDMPNAPIFSGTLQFTVDSVEYSEGQLVIEPYEGSKLMDGNGNIIANVSGVLSNVDFSTELDKTTAMSFDMGGIAWSEYADNFFEQLQNGFEHDGLDEVVFEGPER